MNTKQIIRQAIETLPENERASQIGRLLSNLCLPVTSNYYDHQVKKFNSANEELCLWEKYCAKFIDSTKFDPKVVLHNLKDLNLFQAKFENCFGKSIDQMIIDLTNDSWKTVTKSLQILLEEFNVDLRRYVIDAYELVKGFFSVKHVIRMMELNRVEIQNAADLIERLKRQIAPGSEYALCMIQIEQHLQKANEFYRFGDFRSADLRLNRAGTCSNRAFNIVNSIIHSCEAEIQHLETKKDAAKETFIGNVLPLALSVKDAYNARAKEDSFSFWANSGLAVCQALVMGNAAIEYWSTDQCVKQLRTVLDDIEKNRQDVVNLAKKIDNLYDMVELRRQQNL